MVGGRARRSSLWTSRPGRAREDSTSCATAGIPRSATRSRCHLLADQRQRLPGPHPARQVDDTVIENLYSDSIVGGTGGDFSPSTTDRPARGATRRMELHRTRSHTTVTVPGRWVHRAQQRPSVALCRAAVHQRKSADSAYRATTALPRDRHVAGRADSAEVRLLRAHAQMVEENLDRLTPVGVQRPAPHWSN